MVFWKKYLEGISFQTIQISFLLASLQSNKFQFEIRYNLLWLSRIIKDMMNIHIPLDCMFFKDHALRLKKKGSLISSMIISVIKCFYFNASYYSLSSLYYTQIATQTILSFSFVPFCALQLTSLKNISNLSSFLSMK